MQKQKDFSALGVVGSLSLALGTLLAAGCGSDELKDEQFGFLDIYSTFTEDERDEWESIKELSPNSVKRAFITDGDEGSGAEPIRLTGFVDGEEANYYAFQGPKRAFGRPSAAPPAHSLRSTPSTCFSTTTVTR